MALSGPSATPISNWLLAHSSRSSFCDAINLIDASPASWDKTLIVNVWMASADTSALEMESL